MSNQNYVIGVDVGTQSTRAGVFDLKGTLRGNAGVDISTSYPQQDFVEQSSDDIWEKTGLAIRDAIKQAQIQTKDIVGMSFDATCSLVCLDKRYKPLTISPTGDPSRNIIVWMDHRAIQQADRINQTDHSVLQYVGGRISPEQEPPKLRWIKDNLPETWKSAGKFMDLADFMVFRATGQDMRSLCTSVCKWTYLGHEGETGSWDRDFFEKVGLSDLFHDEKVPKIVYPMGHFAGRLSNESAQELGLVAGISVGVGIIDAHAGGIGVLGPFVQKSSNSAINWDNALALIGGTSSCHMATSATPRFIPGVWGPYYGAMMPGMWLNEGGQSATGSLIDYVIQNNSSFQTIESSARQHNKDIYLYLNQEIERLKTSAREIPDVGKHIHVLPYHLGNRSPRADSHARGVVSGLTLDQTVSSVAMHYYSTVQAIACGTRHIIEAMNQAGYEIAEIYMCGGHTKNNVFLQEHADFTGCPIHLPEEKEAVLLGTAILAAVAAGQYQNIFDGMRHMSRPGTIIQPDLTHQKYRDGKYNIFLKMYDHFKEIRDLSFDL